MEDDDKTEIETIDICSEDSTKANIQALEDKPMTTRTNHESDRQDYDNPEVQNLPRQNYGHAVLEKEREEKPSKD